MIFDEKQCEAIRTYLDLKQDISISNGSGIIAEFESNICKFFNRKYALATVNGTSSLWLSYLSCGINSKSSVIVPSYLHPSVINPLIFLKAKILPVAVNWRILEIDLESVEQKLKSGASTVVHVPMCGVSSVEKQLQELCDNYAATLIEDGSRSYLAVDNDKIFGKRSAITCFSMQGKKALNAGEGGIFLTDNKDLYEKAVLFSQPGREKELNNYSCNCNKNQIITSFKFRPHPLSIVAANVQLPNLKDRVFNSRENFNILRNLLCEIEYFTLLPIPCNCLRGGWQDIHLLSNNNSKTSKLLKELKSFNYEVRYEYANSFIGEKIEILRNPIIVLENLARYDCLLDQEEINKLKRIFSNL